MVIKNLEESDKAFVKAIENHISDTDFRNRVYTKSGYILWENGERIGLISHCILWDRLPFMNLIYVTEKFRNRGFARQAISDWENEMKKRGYKMTLISTQVDETAQHIYRKLGYTDCGALLFDGTPFEQPMEMFMRKVL